MALQVGARRGEAIAAINVTPMADVMIVLLIIFMVATPIIVSPKVKLPDARNGKDAPEKRVDITVRADGRVSIGETETDRDALPALLAGQTENVWVVADTQASYADVESVLRVCRKAGVADIGLEVRPRTN
jgi:biopolymer transport protein TolR